MSEVRELRRVRDEDEVMSGVRVSSARWRETVGCCEGRPAIVCMCMRESVCVCVCRFLVYRVSTALMALFAFAGSLGGGYHGWWSLLSYTRIGM